MKSRLLIEASTDGNKMTTLKISFAMGAKTYILLQEMAILP